MDSYAKYEKCRAEMYKEYRKLIEKIEEKSDYNLETSEKIVSLTREAEGILKAIHILDSHYA